MKLCSNGITTIFLAPKRLEFLKYENMKALNLKLEYKNKTYPIRYEYEDIFNDSIKFLWEEGNYSCDCNRSIFIRRNCDSKFKKLKCGETIHLKSITFSKTL